MIFQSKLTNSDNLLSTTQRLYHQPSSDPICGEHDDYSENAASGLIWIRPKPPEFDFLKHGKQAYPRSKLV
jgi:hypothetical protein